MFTGKILSLSAQGQSGVVERNGEKFSFSQTQPCGKKVGDTVCFEVKTNEKTGKRFAILQK